MSRNRNSLSEFVFLDSFCNPIRVPTSRTHMKGTAITIGGGPSVKSSPSAFLSIPGPCTHRFVCCWRNGIQKEWLVRRRWKVHDLKCTTDSRKICFSSFYVCLCVRTDASVFSLFLSGETSHSLYFLSALFSGRGAEPSHGGVGDSAAQHSHFPPCSAPRCTTLLQ